MSKEKKLIVYLFYQIFIVFFGYFFVTNADLREQKLTKWNLFVDFLNLFFHAFAFFFIYILFSNESFEIKKIKMIDFFILFLFYKNIECFCQHIENLAYILNGIKKILKGKQNCEEQEIKCDLNELNENWKLSFLNGYKIGFVEGKNQKLSFPQQEDLFFKFTELIGLKVKEFLKTNPLQEDFVNFIFNFEDIVVNLSTKEFCDKTCFEFSKFKSIASLPFSENDNNFKFKFLEGYDGGYAEGFYFFMDQNYFKFFHLACNFFVKFSKERHDDFNQYFEDENFAREVIKEAFSEIMS